MNTKAPQALEGEDRLAEPNEISAPAPSHHQLVYETLRRRLIVGEFAPGNVFSLRGISRMLGVGIMPAREAIRRLAAENALEVHQNRRASVPHLRVGRFEELMHARLALEPICAGRALGHMDQARLQRMIGYDNAMNDSYGTGRAEAYMFANYNFHFELYRAGGSEVLVPLLESVWMQFGPFMRTVYDAVETQDIVDKHQMAIDAIHRQDAEALMVAIKADILDGIYLLRRQLGLR